MKKLESILAEKLLKISAIKLQPDNPFTWSSGWNSPIYTDNRKTLSYPETRSFLKVEMSRLIIENFPDAEVVAGVGVQIIHQLVVGSNHSEIIRPGKVCEMRRTRIQDILAESKFIVRQS